VEKRPQVPASSACRLACFRGSSWIEGVNRETEGIEKEEEMLQDLKAATESSATTTGRYRWVVCGLLFFATTVNYMDRQILSLLKPILDNQLHWSNEQFGAVNSAFQGAYAVGGLIFGYLVDRLGTKVGYAVSIAGWSLAAMGHALVSSVSGFFIARMCLGISEAGNFPSSIKTVALWSGAFWSVERRPRHRRLFWTGPGC
jgi:MFS family permease